ncbi:hypothetical protein [Alkalibacter mobilis]|uniref:hypothetical protein n=1 Tax=Alkalibacter mobilis TaxID=2787712 RepID=UPI0018A04411|nr:hypothetical protein [Alkalibacter mobilis]MBF7096457.1 hypothetical protein [Alkalibacter mobilis]
MKKINPKITNVVFYIAILFAGYTLLQTYLAGKNLAPGACPVDDNRFQITISIILMVIYFIMTFFTEENTNQNNKHS